MNLPAVLSAAEMVWVQLVMVPLLVGRNWLKFPVASSAVGRMALVTELLATLRYPE